MKTIDDLIYEGMIGRTINPDELRKLLADSVRECKIYCHWYNQKHAPNYKGGSYCQVCQKVMELMPSVREELQK
jgi:hypothetical protein